MILLLTGRMDCSRYYISCTDTHADIHPDTSKPSRIHCNLSSISPILNYTITPRLLVRLPGGSQEPTSSRSADSQSGRKRLYEARLGPSWCVSSFYFTCRFERVDLTIISDCCSKSNCILTRTETFAAKSSGIIVDTPSSFATGIAGAPSDKKYALVKTCVDAFSSSSHLQLLLSTGKLQVLIHSFFHLFILLSIWMLSQRHSRRRPRKTQRRDAACIRPAHHCCQSAEIRRCTFTFFVLILHE